MKIDKDLLAREINEMGIYLDRHINKNSYYKYGGNFEALADLYSIITGYRFAPDLMVDRIPSICKYANNKDYDGLDNVLYSVEYNNELIMNSFSNFIEILENNGYYERNIKRQRKLFTESEFKQVLLDFYGSIGNREYNIVKKYFDENRIQLGDAYFNKENEAGGVFYFNQLKDTGYILIPKDRIDTISLICASHEFGHAMDYHLSKTQRKQMYNSLISGMFIEFPSSFYETLFVEYLISNHIDLDSAYYMKNYHYSAICGAYEYLNNFCASNDGIDPYGGVPYKILKHDHDEECKDETEEETKEENKKKYILTKEEIEREKNKDKDIVYTKFGEYIDPNTNLVVPIRNIIIYDIAYMIVLNLAQMYKLDKDEILKNFYNTMTTCDLYDFITNLEHLGINLNTFEDCSLIKDDIVKSLKEINKRY